MVLMVVVVSRTSMFDEFLLWVGLEDLCSFGRFQASSDIRREISLVIAISEKGFHCGNQPSIGWSGPKRFSSFRVIRLKVILLADNQP